MGRVVQTVSNLGTNELTRNSFKLTEGILYSVAFNGGNRLFHRFLNWIELGIYTEGSSGVVAATVLVSGKIGPIGSIGWTGRHPVSTDDLLYVDSWGQWQALPTLSWYILKPDPNLSSMQVLDA